MEGGVALAWTQGPARRPVRGKSPLGVVRPKKGPRLGKFRLEEAAMKKWILRSVRDVISDKGQQVWSISGDATVCEALELMAAKRIGAVLVLDASQPVGIFSERDFARNAVHETRPPTEIRVREIMSSELVYVNPDKTVEDCMELMTQRRMRHLPVHDGRRLVGLISIGDVVKWIITEQESAIDQLEHYISGPYGTV